MLIDVVTRKFTYVSPETSGTHQRVNKSIKVFVFHFVVERQKFLTWSAAADINF